MKFMSEAEQAATLERCGAEVGDLLLFQAAPWASACTVLGTLRNELGRPPVSEGGLHFLWVVEFPMFVGQTDDGKPIPGHHPFTHPMVEDIDKWTRTRSTAAPRPTT